MRAQLTERLPTGRQEVNVSCCPNLPPRLAVARQQLGVQLVPNVLFRPPRNLADEPKRNSGGSLKEDKNMTTLTASEARAQLYKLVDRTANSHEPVQITGKRNNAVLVSEEDWRSIQETLYLLSMPGMRESIRKGLKTPIKKCSPNLDW